MALPCPLRVSIVGNKLWRQLTVGPAAPHPWAAVSSPPSAPLRLGSGSLPHAAWTLLHSACCPQSPWTTCLACLQLATQSCVSRTLPEGLLEHLGSPTFTQVPKQTAFKEKAPLALPAPGMGQRWEVKTVSGQTAGDFPGLQQTVGARAGTSHLCSDGDAHLPSLGLLSITGHREVWHVYLYL